MNPQEARQESEIGAADPLERRKPDGDAETSASTPDKRGVDDDRETYGGEREAYGEGGDASEAKRKKRRRAGVESFVVDWKQSEAPGRKKANLYLEFTAKFKDDDDHDPAVAQFRQNAAHDYTITYPDGAVIKNSTPLEDDGYSRDDDHDGNVLGDVDFRSDDYPGWPDDRLRDDAHVDYTFTAEQMITDTSRRRERTVAKRGPHTATITGAHPRVFDGVPWVES